MLDVCALETEDSRAVYKNINVDMRQYKRLRMFIHAEEGANPGLSDGDIVGFIRMGNDLTQNYYQIEVPLQRSSSNTLDPQSIWPEINEINLPIEVLESIKALGITNGTLANEDPIFYNVFADDLVVEPVNEFSEYQMGQHRVSIKGNPNFGDIRTLMVGVKNPRQDNMDVCGTVWFNELRLSDMDNEGGWAATVTIDTNIADFMSLSATGRQSTSGFGSIEQGPNERDIEDKRQYDLVSNINVGQLLPEKWGVSIPFNFGVSEELITPELINNTKILNFKLD